jgi:DNA (cytosine-5)-methyltransferase 1
MVSVLGDYYYEFPKPIKLELCVKDLLESEVAEKYYISAERVKELLNKEYDGKKGILPNSAKIMTTYPLSTREHRALGWTENVSALTARDCKDPKVVCQPCLTPDRLKKRQNGRRLKENGDPMFTLTAQDIHGVIIGGMQKNQTIKKDGIAIRTNNEKGYDIAQDGDTINLEQPNSKTRRGRVGKQIAQTLNTSTQQAVVEKIIACEIRTDGVVTYKDVDKDEQEEIDDDTFSNGEYGYVIDKETGKPIEFGGFRIRKLMPIECYRLMGFTREDFFKVKEAGISDSQCYKQAGNSIVVDVLEAIFRNMNIKGVKRWND